MSLLLSILFIPALPFVFLIIGFLSWPLLLLVLLLGLFLVAVVSFPFVLVFQPIIAFVAWLFMMALSFGTLGLIWGLDEFFDWIMEEEWLDHNPI